MAGKKPFSRVFLGWAALWALAALVWCALLGLEWYTTDALACPLTPDASLHGTAHWSWWPPGRVCSWEVTVGGETHTLTEEAPAARLGTLAVLVLWGACVFTAGSRRGRAVG